MRRYETVEFNIGDRASGNSQAFGEYVMQVDPGACVAKLFRQEQRVNGDHHTGLFCSSSVPPPLRAYRRHLGGSMPAGSRRYDEHAGLKPGATMGATRSTTPICGLSSTR